MKHCFILAALLCTSAAHAGVWPQFLGPHRDGSSEETVSASWPDAGPKRVWKQDVGQGFSGPIVASGKVLLFHRVENEERIEALDPASGSVFWSHAEPTRYRDDFGFDEGPRATPAAVEGKVVCLGAEARLTCVQLVDGKRLWTHDLQAEFSASKGFFGVAGSPLIQDGRVIASIGGASGAGVVAFDLATGKLLWKSVEDECSYASPAAGLLKGKPALYCLLRSGLFVLGPSDGKVLSQHAWRPGMQASVSAASPLLLGARVFLTASYGAGALMLDYSGESAREVWNSKEGLASHYATPVQKAGFIYGFDGRQEYGPAFVCLRASDGKVIWRKDGFGAGTATLSGDHLVILLEKGEVALVRATSTKYEEIARAQVLGSGVRAYPALADGALYARDKKILVRIDLK